jgi:nucleoside-diphosphate-sugar epimerase
MLLEKAGADGYTDAVVSSEDRYMTIILTGAAGFIGYHVCEALLARGERVVGVDNLNDYYDPALKQARLDRLTGRNGFSFHKLDFAERERFFELFDSEAETDRVIHLAAQAGVRNSLIDPYTYVDTNVMGQLVVLEACRRLPGLTHLVYASSSSVYGGSEELPFSLEDRVDKPLSLYAATKRAGELMGHSYAHLYRLPLTGLRFFTVYGPWGRPDMSAYLFTKAIFEGAPISVFNQGDMRRDFTYIDDLSPVFWQRWTGRRPMMLKTRRTESITWGITAPRTSCASSPFWSKPVAAKRSRISRGCSPGTSRKPTPISRPRGRISGSSRALASTKACRVSYSGTANTTASESQRRRFW